MRVARRADGQGCVVACCRDVPSVYPEIGLGEGVAPPAAMCAGRDCARKLKPVPARGDRGKATMGLVAPAASQSRGREF